MKTYLQNAHVIDPAQSLDHAMDVCIQGGRILDLMLPGTTVAAAGDRVLDLTGCVVMAGGIDLHTHIGGGKVTLARMLLEDFQADARDEFLPTASLTARRYLDMGYTTCFEPAVIPCNARSAHCEMADVRGIDTGGYCLLGNDQVLLQLIADQQPQQIINDYVAWIVSATKCLAVKVVNPGGIDAFKYNQRMMDVDTPHVRYGITPAMIIRTLCRAVHEIGLAHPLHVHCSNLGVPGNIRSTLATIQAAAGYPIHLTHAQFHCYGDDGPYRMSSAAAALAKALRDHPNVTIDVGQIMFGQTVTISADTMHQHVNGSHAKPRKSVLVDVQCEAGCGVVPFRYRRRQFVHSLQWAIGLELFLMIDDPSRVFLTTDHPNGGPFTAYPHLIRLLGDRSYRETALAEIHPDAAASSDLSGMRRQYTLAELATMTRSAPAEILGLSELGNLRVGSVADLVAYRRADDLEAMFRTPELVMRRGGIARNRIRNSDGSITTDDASGESDQTLFASLEFDSVSVARLIADHRKQSGVDLRQLWISADELDNVIGSRGKPITATRSA